MLDLANTYSKYKYKNYKNMQHMQKILAYCPNVQETNRGNTYWQHYHREVSHLEAAMMEALSPP